MFPYQKSKLFKIKDNNRLSTYFVIQGIIFFPHDSQEISSLTRQFPAPTQERKQSLEEYSHARATPGPDLGHGVSSESTVISDSVQTGLNSPVSVFKPITAPPDTLEERTLSPPQCRLEHD